MHKDYILDSASDLGAEQLAYSQRLFDPFTIEFLEPLDVRPGWRCLDLGAGNGSVSGWLAERTGPEWPVLAVDVDTDHLTARPGVEVIRRDLNDGVPGGPYDLIHTRLTLMHLKRREQIFSDLVDALAPGGWLVVGDSVNRPQEVLSAPSEADAQLVRRLTDIALDMVVNGFGVSLEWANEVDAHMVAAGMVNLQALERCRMMTGDSIECLLNDNYFRQAEQPLRNAGITRGELDRFHAVMRDPRFRAWPWLRLVYTRGQKPVG